jgi:hypothetical protein
MAQNRKYRNTGVFEIPAHMKRGASSGVTNRSTMTSTGRIALFATKHGMALSHDDTLSWINSRAHFADYRCLQRRMYVARVKRHHVDGKHWSAMHPG